MRLLTLALFLLAGCLSLSAQSFNCGSTTQHGSTDATASNFDDAMITCVPSQSGTVTSCSIYILAWSAFANSYLHCAIYASDHATLLYEAWKNVGNGQTGWVTITGMSYNVTGGTTYWIGRNASINGATGASYQVSATAGTEYYQAQSCNTGNAACMANISSPSTAAFTDDAYLTISPLATGQQIGVFMVGP